MKTGEFTFQGTRFIVNDPAFGGHPIAQPRVLTLREYDVKYRCTCCTYAKKVIVTLDPEGREQYTCPETRITLRYIPCRPLPVGPNGELVDSSTYLTGRIIAS